MSSSYAVLIAALINLLLRISVFIPQPTNQCSPLSTIASWLISISTILLLLDIDIFPNRYTNIPKPCQLFAETIMCLLLHEFCTIFIWCRLENSFYIFMKDILMENNSNMYYDMGGDSLTGFLINFLSILILWNVCMATNVTKKGFYRNYRRTINWFNKIWYHFMWNQKQACIKNIKTCDQPKSLKSCDSVNQCQENENSDCNCKISTRRTNRNPCSGIPKIKKNSQCE